MLFICIRFNNSLISNQPTGIYEFTVNKYDNFVAFFMEFFNQILIVNLLFGDLNENYRARESSIRSKNQD